MVRVLLLCEYPSLNGGERSLLALLDCWRDRQFDFVAAAPSVGPLADALRAKGIPVRDLPTRDRGGRRAPQGRRREALASIIAALDPQLVHANSLSMGRLSGPVVVDCGKPGVSHLRDIVRLSAQAAADLNRHTRLLAVSQATRQWHVAQGIAPEKIHVAYNGVDLERFQPRAPSGYLHAELGLPRQAMLVGAIGQLGMRKGLDLLIAAARDVALRFDQTHFLVVGRRYSQKDEAVLFQRRLETAAASPPLAGRFHLLGAREDVDRLLNELTLLAHAARQEPLGRVLLEAAAAGLPVVASRAGGTREIFPESLAAAQLVPVGDRRALAEALARVLSDQSLRRQLGQAARRRAEAAFDAHRAADELAQHYRAALEG